MDGATKIAAGVGLFLLGVVITAATYSAAEGGGHYMLMWGPIVFGPVMAFRGLAELKNDREAAASDPVTAPVIRGGGIDADDYPASALEAGAEGVVTLGYVVDPAGRPIHLELLGSSGNAALDDRALALMGERFHFDPARNARGEPVEAYHKTSIRWQLPA